MGRGIHAARPIGIHAWASPMEGFPLGPGPSVELLVELFALDLFVASLSFRVL